MLLVLVGGVVIALLQIGRPSIGSGIGVDHSVKDQGSQDGVDAATGPVPPLAVAPFDAAQARARQAAWAKYLRVPVEVENSAGMKLRLIPPGEYLMGTSQADLQAARASAKEHAEDLRNDSPQRRVAIKAPFFLGTYEVTVGQFRRFVAAKKYRTLAETNGRGGQTWDVDAKKVVTSPEIIWSNPRFTPSEEHPVRVLTLPDAQAFCAWLNGVEGARYVVPDEEHWEYACRAGTTGLWCSGNDPKQAAEYGWFTPESNWTPHPVGKKLPNAFGLFDMHGNVDEWVENARPLLLRSGHSGFSAWGGRAAFRDVAVGKADEPWDSWGFRVAVVGNLSRFARP